MTRRKMSETEKDQPIASTSASVNVNGNGAGSSNGEHITEDEASLYDRQIRLWGLEAQNRMRSSTVLIISLRGVSHEIIKNLVLAGIGKLIVMDGGLVTEEDLGSGFLFREEDGAVGKQRTTAAEAQISSLNPLVSLRMIPTVSPFIRDMSTDSSASGSAGSAADWLKQEAVDVVVACDLKQQQVDDIEVAAREAGAMFYATGSYGFYGYAFADLGDNFDFVYTPASASEGTLVKGRVSYPSRFQALDSSDWTLDHDKAAEGGSPFRGLMRQATRTAVPQTSIGILALWEYEKRHGSSPAGQNESIKEMMEIAEDLRIKLGINTKAIKEVDYSMIEHLARHADHQFPPTLAILGGLVAQDVLRALSKRGTPFINLLTVDSMGGTGAVVRWGMADIQAGV